MIASSALHSIPKESPYTYSAFDSGACLILCFRPAGGFCGDWFTPVKAKGETDQNGDEPAASGGDSKGLKGMDDAFVDFLSDFFTREQVFLPPSFPFMVCVRWVTVCWPLTSRRGPSSLATRFLPALPCCVACGREWGGGFYMECIEPACDNYQRMSGLYVPGRSSKRTGLFPTAPGRVCRESPQCPCL